MIWGKNETNGVKIGQKRVKIQQGPGKTKGLMYKCNSCKEGHSIHLLYAISNDFKYMIKCRRVDWLFLFEK